MTQPLAGLKVLDFSRLLPGPYATLLLADLGAQVDMVEEPKGEPLRAIPPSMGDESALFYGLNRNKRSLVLDLKSPLARSAVERLVLHYDILVESFRPGVMARLGLSHDRLQALHPRLIVCAITGYGQTGPDRLKAGHDLNFAARAGLLGYGGQTEGAAAMPGGLVADIGGGSLFGVIGILTALWERERTGKGRLLDIAMADGATAFLHMRLAARLAVGEGGPPLARDVEPLNGGMPGYRVYRTADGRGLAVGALEPKFMGLLCERLGHPEWAELALGDAQEREQARRSFTDCFAQKSLAQWRGLLDGLDACVEPVAEGDDVLTDPQFRARGLFAELPDAKRGRAVGILRTPLPFGDIPLQPPPTLGEHTSQVLAEAGFSASEISALA